MSTFMCNNSGFGWDSVAKTYTTTEESHPSHKNLQEKSMIDYDYLKIVVGGGVSSGNNSIALDPGDTDATTFEQESESFVMEAQDNYEPPNQPPSPNQPTPPPHFSLDSEVPIEKRNRHKRNRSEYRMEFLHQLKMSFHYISWK
ncbi:hypothetical protein MTR_0002s1260 [Medicago truncatula]|uniref:Myb/SANT-like DNA-binding domain protein n=1 Tax=Medicago truncatula TaxID=3880 RepID=A0A072TW46_MEDTR|nr:hypothetical protein MTR_0002s1240 [Medicago truncatula]KEH17745.1 hypothetical protein MTR_0002s1260 [Medicago truncatula]